MRTRPTSGLCLEQPEAAGSPSTTVGKQVVLPVRSLMSSSPRCHTAVPRCHRCHRVQLTLLSLCIYTDRSPEMSDSGDSA